jgi:hypothetical protein
MLISLDLTTNIILNFRVRRNPSRVDANREDHFPQADLSLLIGLTWITSGLATTRQVSALSLRRIEC